MGSFPALLLLLVLPGKAFYHTMEQGALSAVVHTAAVICLYAFYSGHLSPGTE